MDVLHCISGLNINSGGPSLSTWSLIIGLRNYGINADILTYQTQNEKDKMFGEGDFVHALKSPKFLRFGYSTLFYDFLVKIPYELYHGHGLWQYPVHAIAKHARKTGKPYIISPRGMLYPEGLKKSSSFKRIALPLYQRKDLERATVLHATCMQEVDYIRKLGLKNPVAVVPNAIDINIPLKIEEISNGKRKVGFIGRFAPIKNLENLIKAWTQTGKNLPNWELVLIGDGTSEYRKNLEKLSIDLGIDNILFTGFLSGEEKEKMLNSLSYLVLPSKSENFGMVVPEALIREIPVIASKGAPWEELNTHNAGWWIDIGVEPLVKALKEALQLSEEERKLKGLNGRKLIEGNYSIEIVTQKMVQLYEWILKKTEKPDFVF